MATSKMSDIALAKAKNIASKIVENLDGYGLFGVELFVQGDEVFLMKSLLVLMIRD